MSEKVNPKIVPFLKFVAWFNFIAGVVIIFIKPLSGIPLIIAGFIFMAQAKNWENKVKQAKRSEKSPDA